MTWHPDIPEEYRNQIVTGDARELTKRIPDDSIDLIFTDPVYDRIEDYEWLAKEAGRILKQDKSLLAFCGHSREIEMGSTMVKFLTSGPILSHVVNGPKGRLFSHSTQNNIIPCLWFSKGLPDSKWQYIEVHSVITGKRMHKWGKSQSMFNYRIEKFTEIEAVIFDPFVGGGTTAAACKELGRNYIAFEIDSDTAELARERVLNTQPPLFVLEPEQEEMNLEIP